MDEKPKDLWHVHVYNITALYETDVYASTEEEARSIALKESENNAAWKKTDKNKLALSFKERYRRVLCDK